MLKNRFFSVFALVALAGLAACETEEAEVEPVIEEPVVTEPATAPVVEPAAPVVTDTAVVAPGAEGTEGTIGTEPVQP